MKALQSELNQLNTQVKERDQEYRLNELKIKELRRQLPAKVLKPIDSKARLGTPTRQSPALPPQVPKPASATSTSQANHADPLKEKEVEKQKGIQKQNEDLKAAKLDNHDTIEEQ